MFNIVSDTLVRPQENHYHDLITLERAGFEEKVWLNLEIIGNGADAESIKRVIQISFEDIFFTEPTKNAYERFEETLKEVNLLLKNLKEKNEDQRFCDIHAVIAVQDNDNLHLTQTGEAEAYLIRHGKLAVVSEGLSVRKNSTSDIFMNIASGETAFDDKVVFTSRRLLRNLTAQQIANIFMQDVSDALASINLEIQDNAALAITCVHFKKSVFGNIKIEEKNQSKVMQSEPLQKVKQLFDDFILFLAKKMGKNPSQMERVSLLTGAAAIIIILVLTVTIMFSNNQNKEKYTEYQSSVTNAMEELKRAEKLALMEDNESANAILNKVEGRVVQILNDGYFREESVQILDKVKDLRDEVNSIQRIKNPKILADVSTKRDGINLLGMVSLNDKLFGYEYNALYETILDVVENPLTISSSEKVNNAVSMPEKDLIIFTTPSGKVIEYNDGQFSLAETSDEMWKKSTAMAVYSKYLYLLSPEENQIWKYERRTSAYTKASKYNLDADLSKALDIAIDGNVFVLSAGGEIIKLYRGNQVQFDVQSLTIEDGENVSQIFTLPDQNYIYLLNPQKNSILIVRKLSNGQGEYIRQVVLEGIGQIVDFYVSQNEQRLFVIDKEKIYEIGL